MSVQHTPGPWEVHEGHVYATAHKRETTIKHDDGTSEPYTEGLTALVYVPFEAVIKSDADYKTLHDANARLIASAPELSEAATLVIEAANASHTKHQHSVALTSALYHLAEVLSKATATMVAI
jgi:hypothetical protein